MTSNKQLQEKVKLLERENIKLNEQLEELNENTIISSMNDMKLKYEFLVNHTVGIRKYENLKSYYKTASQMNTTINTINIVNHENTVSLKTFLENYTANCTHFDEVYRNRRVASYLKSIQDRIQLMMEIYSRTDDEEWDECECFSDDDD